MSHILSTQGAAWSRTEFEARLREQGKAYHIHHPFNVMLNTGKATPDQIRGWVANRFSYQVAIPVKDAAVLGHADHHYRQAITAAGTGSAAALDAERYLADLDHAAAAEPAVATV